MNGVSGTQVDDLRRGMREFEVVVCLLVCELKLGWLSPRARVEAVCRRVGIAEDDGDGGERVV